MCARWGLDRRGDFIYQGVLLFSFFFFFFFLFSPTVNCVVENQSNSPEQGRGIRGSFTLKHPQLTEDRLRALTFPYRDVVAVIRSLYTLLGARVTINTWQYARNSLTWTIEFSIKSLRRLLRLDPPSSELLRWAKMRTAILSVN